MFSAHITTYTHPKDPLLATLLNLSSISIPHHFIHETERVFKHFIEFSLPSVAAQCGSPAIHWLNRYSGMCVFVCETGAAV